MHRAGRARAAGRRHDVRSSVRLRRPPATRLPAGLRLAAPHRLQNREWLFLTRTAGLVRRCIEPAGRVPPARRTFAVRLSRRPGDPHPVRPSPRLWRIEARTPPSEPRRNVIGDRSAIARESDGGPGSRLDAPRRALNLRRDRPDYIYPAADRVRSGGELPHAGRPAHAGIEGARERRVATERKFFGERRSGKGGASGGDREDGSGRFD